MSTLLKVFAYIVVTFLVYGVLAPILISANSWVLVICGALIVGVHVFATVWLVLAKTHNSSITEIRQ